jgi:predicted transposase YdaD
MRPRVQSWYYRKRKRRKKGREGGRNEGRNKGRKEGTNLASCDIGL